MEPQRASDLKDISRYIHPTPLSRETWFQYVDTDEARGRKPAVFLISKLIIAHQEQLPIHAILTGHTGCGKSTELVRISRELDDTYDVVLCQVEDRYALPGLEYRQLLFLCAHLLIEHAQKRHVSLKAETAKAIAEWFESREEVELKKEGHEVQVESGGGVDFLGALFAKFYGRIYSGGERQSKAIKHIEQRLDQLQRNMALVVHAIEEKIAPRRVLLVLEGLDKIEDIDQARRIFVDHRLQLLSVPCSAILTFPIRLWLDSEDIQAYPVRYQLPMVPVAAPPVSLDLNEAAAQAKAERGRDTLKSIIAARVDLSRDLIAPDALEYLIAKSGGVLRDLMYMLREAALEALVAGGERIEKRHATAAALALRNEYVNRLSPSSRNASITIDEIKKTLGAAADWPRNEADHTPAFKLLLQNLCISEYNGETWYDLHPLVRDYLRLKEAAEAARKARSSPA